MKLIYIEWADATGIHHWQTHDEALEWAEEEQCIIKQVGWVLKEDKKYLVIASRRGRHIFDSDTDEDQAFGMIQKIPKTWIRKRKVIKL